jgi:hypothetical protein
MPQLTALVGLLLGLVAVVAAMRVRRDLASGLGRDWRVRFFLVQGVLINGTLFAVIRYVSHNLGWTDPASLWLVSGLYGLLFFGYSLSNVDWTARKFHGVEG